MNKLYFTFLICYLFFSSCSKIEEFLGEESNDSTVETVISDYHTLYEFNGDFNDSSENSIDGFGYNKPEFVDGINNQAIKFNRVSDSKFIVGEPIIDSKEMTISFWGKNFSDGHIFHMLSSINSEPMFVLSMNGGNLKFTVTRGNTRYDESNSFVHPPLTDGQWHHIVLVSDFSKRSYSTITTDLYVDGKKVYQLTEDANVYSEDGGSASSYGTGTVFTMGGELSIGSRKINGTNMCIDNFRVYNTRMLSDAEIKKIYDGKL